MVRAIQLEENDDVAVVVSQADRGSTAEVDSTIISVVDKIPHGHKIALRNIDRGEVVRKYGEAIGIATAPIARGQHVHIHNLASSRAKQA